MGLQCPSCAIQKVESRALSLSSFGWSVILVTVAAHSVWEVVRRSACNQAGLVVGPQWQTMDRVARRGSCPVGSLGFSRPLIRNGSVSLGGESSKTKVGRTSGGTIRWHNGLGPGLLLPRSLCSRSG